MLPFRKRTNRSGGRPLESHGSPVAAVRHSPLHASTNKNSLRNRLRDLKGSITRRSSPGYNETRTGYTSNQWYDVKSIDDLLSMGPADARHIELAGQTWPAIRHSISSMASSLRTSHDSASCKRSPGEGSQQSQSRRSKICSRVSHQSARRWATIATRVAPVAGRRSTSQIRHSSFSTISEVVPRQDYDAVPRLPGLAESGNFLESLSKTGLFRLFTPLSEVNVTTGHVRPIVARLPLRLRSPDSLFHKATGYPVYKRVRGQREGSRVKEPDPSTMHTEKDSPQTDHNKPHQQHTIKNQEKSQRCDSSRHPIRWLDRILETSYATRNPISPRLCVSKATMEFLRKNKTCIYVEFPRHEGLPGPLQCYPGFRAALEDICDRFGNFYAPFAAYNAHTRMITLYTTNTVRPEDRFIDEDTALFDLETARSAWVRPAVNHVLSTNVTEKSTSPATSGDLTEVSDGSLAGSEETGATDLEERELDELKQAEKAETWTVSSTSHFSDTSSGDNDAVDEDMASRLGC
ncbi:hypothetical protein FHL15_004265 [Xylaria flabelliformis]|uniref:Uncharacterized protein n=1 Tax=Xylaria flabelliformis TaxID=2512241 RepID=A0A553I3M4_9PEZI|nr:hypothetical protein FHL15_004265 [Xylaria flabelliformis]